MFRSVKVGLQYQKSSVVDEPSEQPRTSRSTLLDDMPAHASTCQYFDDQPTMNDNQTQTAIDKPQKSMLSVLDTEQNRKIRI